MLLLINTLWTNYFSLFKTYSEHHPVRQALVKTKYFRHHCKFGALLLVNHWVKNIIKLITIVIYD